MLSSNRNFKSANMLLQDMLIHTNIICSKLPLVLYHQCSYTYGQIWVGHWLNSACRATLSAPLFSKWSVQIQESFCFSSEVVWALYCMYKAFASYLPRRMEITSRAGVRLTSCGPAQRVFTAFLASCRTLILCLSSIWCSTLKPWRVSLHRHTTSTCWS